MDRFAAYLLVRRFLKQPESRNRALAAEAIMEELASEVAAAGQQSASWGVLGLLSQLDSEYAEHNPKARGFAARDQAVLEGLDPVLAGHLVSCRDPAHDPSALEAALLVADHLASAALAAERRNAEGLAGELELQRGYGDPNSDLLDRAMSVLQMTGAQAAMVAMRALERVAEDLR